MTGFHKWITATMIVAVLACIAGPVLMSETKGKIAAIRPERSEFVLTESFKDLTFQLAGDATILINGHSSRFSDLREGDSARVVFERQGHLLLAMVVRVNRKVNGRPAQSDITAVVGLPRWETQTAAGPTK